MALDGATVLESVPVPPDPITRKDGDLSFIARVAAAARVARSVPTVGMCLTRPDLGETKPPLAPQDKRLASALDSVLQLQPGLTLVPGPSFELRLTRGACGAPSKAPSASDKDAAPTVPEQRR